MKDGYTGVWEDYTIIRGDITVNAKYTAIEYTITFMDDDMVIASDTYTVEDKEIMVPSVPPENRLYKRMGKIYFDNRKYNSKCDIHAH